MTVISISVCYMDAAARLGRGDGVAVSSTDQLIPQSSCAPDSTAPSKTRKNPTSSYPKKFIFVMQEVETSRWGRRREWEDALIRSSAPKVLSRLWEATCQRQTLMRFLRGRMLINFMTKHVNIKSLQIQFSAVKKMPFYWLRWTGLSLWSGHRAAAVVTEGEHSCAAANLLPRWTCSPLQRTLDNPDTSSPSRPRLLWKENKYPGQEGTAELRWHLKCFTGSSSIPGFLFLLAFCRPAQTAPGTTPFFVTRFWVTNFWDISLPWALTPSLKSDAYKLDCLQRL